MSLDPKRAVNLLITNGTENVGGVMRSASIAEMERARELGALAIEAMEARVLKSEVHSGKNIDAAHHAEVAYLAAAHPEKKE